MSIYREDPIARAIGVRPIYEIVPDFYSSITIPEDATFNNKGVLHPLWGSEMSDETKMKIGISQRRKYAKGLHPWIGRKHTDQSNQKNRIAHLGKKHSEETKTKIGLSRKGYLHSEESRKKISESLKGKKNSLGVKRSPETRAKIAAARMGKPTRIKKGETFVSPSNLD